MKLQTTKNVRIEGVKQFSWLLTVSSRTGGPSSSSEIFSLTRQGLHTNVNDPPFLTASLYVFSEMPMEIIIESKYWAFGIRNQDVDWVIIYFILHSFGMTNGNRIERVHMPINVLYTACHFVVRYANAKYIFHNVNV